MIMTNYFIGMKTLGVLTKSKDSVCFMTTVGFCLTLPRNFMYKYECLQQIVYIVICKILPGAKLANTHKGGGRCPYRNPARS